MEQEPRHHPCSKLLAQYVCCRAVTDTLPPCFMELNVTVEKIEFVSVCGISFFFFDKQLTTFT